MTDPIASSAAVRAALKSKGVEAPVVVLPQSGRTAKDAAAAIGCSVEQIAESLVFRRTDTDEPLLVIASGGQRVDEQRIAAHIKAEIVMADANFVRFSTGFAIDGVPPLGHKIAIETLVDQSLLRFDKVWAAAGTPHTVFAIDPRRLVEITGAHLIAV